jgi:glutaminyl-peptide cyclotransferase
MVNPKTGQILKQIKLDNRLFAEGATIVNGLLYILTWKNHVVVVIDVEKWILIAEVPMNFTPSVSVNYSPNSLTFSSRI